MGPPTLQPMPCVAGKPAVVRAGAGASAFLAHEDADGHRNWKLKAGNLKQSSVQVHIASMLAKLGVACKPVGALSRAVRGAIA